MKNHEMTSSVLFLALCLACTPESKDPGTDGPDKPPQEVVEYEEMTIPSTLIRTSCADPCLIYKDGKFYLTMTGSSNIVMVVDSDLNRLNTQVHPTGSCTYIYKSDSDPNVQALYGAGATINGTWSPELHYFSEEDFPGQSGWYLFLGLRKSGSDNSADINTVILKSRTGALTGPYVHPTTDVQYSSQTLLDKNGKPLNSWIVGMSILRIPSGQYKGVYGTFVDEVGRDTGYGNFYQRLRIARLSSPWQLASEMYTITSPTQDWEKKGASSKLPMVVEGGTAIYGDDGEIFMAYCGSGYWSDYGLGQLTLRRENGDYCNPMEQSSWLKYEKNPIFTSSLSSDLRGAGHAFFLKDDAGNRFLCYHAYPFENGVKSKQRNAYIEPYYIDYSIMPDSAPQGVIKFGSLSNGRTAPVGETSVTFYKTK